MLSDCKCTATVMCAFHAKTIQRHNNLASIHDHQNEGHCYSITQWSKRDQIPPLNFLDFVTYSCPFWELNLPSYGQLQALLMVAYSSFLVSGRDLAC